MTNVLEVIILIQIKKKTPSIRHEQYTFKPQHSTTNQLTKVIDHQVNCSNHREKTAEVFLDIEKAFDENWIDGLLHKLLQLKLSSSLKLVYN